MKKFDGVVTLVVGECNKLSEYVLSAEIALRDGLINSGTTQMVIGIQELPLIDQQAFCSLFTFMFFLRKILHLTPSAPGSIYCVLARHTQHMRTWLLCPGSLRPTRVLFCNSKLSIN